MRLSSIAVIAMILVAAGCRQAEQEHGAGMRSEPGGEIAIKPYKVKRNFLISGDLANLYTDPIPVDSVIHLIKGEKVRILAKNYPSLGRPVLIADSRGDTISMLGPGGGQHVEILIDDDEQTARIATNFPIELDPLEEGTHIVRVYLCSADNECIKDAVQVGFLPIHINKKTNDTNFAKLPTIAYTQPLKYCRSRNVVLDFALHEVPVDEHGVLLNGYSVFATLSNSSGMSVTAELKEWQPCDIENLRPGKYTLNLQLRQNGVDIPSSFAHTTRTFYVVGESR